MEKAIQIVVSVVITLIALSMAISGTFDPFKQNQSLLNSSNTTMFGQLNAEISNSSNTNVAGSYIKNLMDNNVGKADVISIKIDGSYTWNGKEYATCGITINDSDQYAQKIIVETGKAVYNFTKVK